MDPPSFYREIAENITIHFPVHMGVSENVVYPFLPNGFADHYPY